MRIGIVGNGVVGSATARTYIEHHEVWVYDIVQDRCTHLLSDILNCDLTFVCLPTNPLGKGEGDRRYDEGGCDLRPIDRFFALVADCGSEFLGNHFVLRSTVPVGTTRDLRAKYLLPNLIHSPEFLTARCSFVDALTPSRHIIGSRCRGDVLQPIGCSRTLFELYKSRFPSVQVIETTCEESEFAKLAVNGFFSVKVAFFNEINAYCRATGLNWDAVLSAILSDGRIAHSHTQVPGPDGKYGFGGSCLPKDLEYLIRTLRTEDCDGCLVTEAAQDRNEEDRLRRC